MARTSLSRTPLSKHAGVLRSSLLLALGVSPLACGGTAITAAGDDGGASSSQAGAPTYGGSLSSSGAGPNPAGGAASCPNPVFDPDTKLVACSNGLVHRAQALTCTFTMPPDASGAGGDTGAAGSSDAGSPSVPSSCQVNADCAALPLGYCDSTAAGGFALPVCRAGCTEDSECGSGQICACNGVNPGRCTAASCATDADCGPNSLCAITEGICGAGSFQCTSPADECLTFNDCMSAGRIGACSFEGTHRVCSGAVCGRPFLIAELPRVAAIEPRTDWLDATLTPNLHGLTPVQRAQLAAHWARLGQMEHASIAAFARFQLQLLSLGAPSDLVEACNRALADETAHTRACFALASAYGGMPVGPARLDIEYCFEDTSLSGIAKLVLREGCLGETAASLEALAAADAASDPAVKQALTLIARDERRHAQLAFEFLRWALGQSSAEARATLAREAARQLADFDDEACNAQPTRDDGALAAHGLLAGDALRAVHLAAVRGVTRPLLSALFDVEACSAV